MITLRSYQQLSNAIASEENEEGVSIFAKSVTIATPLDKAVAI